MSTDSCTRRHSHKERVNKDCCGNQILMPHLGVQIRNTQKGVLRTYRDVHEFEPWALSECR